MAINFIVILLPVSGMLTPVTGAYEIEQQKLERLIETLEIEVNSETEKAVNVGSFLKLIQKHTNIKELNSTILREFIEKIIIHERVKIDGVKSQKVEIHYNFIGLVDIPDKTKIAESA
ncbi:MAG: DUF4368 domain-containing protein [Clostridiaceae bacterium]|jgi:hypothetical protein|nr:DUF4368 domain-containing protein [Clostridiaceae bacterium]